MTSSFDMEKEEIVKNALFKFLKQHLPSSEASSIDEIVLSYVVSILEELGEEPSGDVEDVFDAEGFCEMMGAYVPDFSSISLPNVCQWMFELEAKLRQTRDRNDSFSLDRDLSELVSVRCESGGGGEKPPRVHQLSETSDASCSSDSSGDFSHQEVCEVVCSSEEVEMLQEMFPCLSVAEAHQCLTIAGGDVHNATQLVLHRQETGQTLTHSLMQHGGQQKCVVDDRELKSRIIARYSFVDKEDDAREHRPVAPKQEPKKLVRYRDNKIVSMKGERFTEVKRDEEEEKRGGWGVVGGRGARTAARHPPH